MHKEAEAPATPYLPATQRAVQVEDLRPLVLPNRPAGHGVHKMVRLALEKDPASQGVFTPPAQKLPASQGLHCAALVAAGSVEKVPSGQVMQLVKSAE